MMILLSLLPYNTNYVALDTLRVPRSEADLVPAVYFF